MKSLHRAVEQGRSGVYRLDPGASRELEPLARGAGLALHRVVLADATKPAILAALAGALRFPEWFGGNWDALQDALCDLSWLPERRGDLVVVEGSEAVRAAAPHELDTLIEVLRTVASYWKGEGRPFLVLVTGRLPDLPALTSP